MAKTSDHDERDEDEELEEESSSEASNDEDEAEASVPRGGARRRARAHEGTHGHGDDHDHEDAADESEDLDDPYWWTPHAVLSGLVIVGVLGFFGAFNKVLGFAAAVPEDAEQAAAVTERSAAPAAPKPPALTGARGVDPQQMGAKHLLVTYKGSLRAAATVERSKDAARARATEAMTKAKDSKNKFEDVVKEYSDDATTSSRGGDLGRFSKNSMVPEFQAAVEKLKVGEVSEVVETPFGFHVIQRTF